MRSYETVAICVLMLAVPLVAVGQTVDSVAPSGVVRGRTTEVLIRGEGLGGFTSLSTNGTGFSTSGFVAESDELLRFSVGIGDRAALRTVDVTLEGSGELVVEDAFSIIAGPLELLGVEPEGASRGQTVVLELIGRNLDTVSNVSLGEGITIGAYEATSPVNATVEVTVTEDAFSGPRAISLGRADSVTTVENVFTVAGGALQIVDLDPEVATRGQALTVSLQGSNLDRIESVSFGPRIDVRSLEVLSPRMAEATIEVRDDAAVGPRGVDWTSDDASGTVVGKFAVRAGPLSVTRVRPLTGAQGSSTVISVEGFNLDGLDEVDAGEGITIGSIDARFAGVAAVTLHIGLDAPVGYRDIAFEGPHGRTTVEDAFYVSEYVAPEIDLVFESPVVVGHTQVGARSYGAFYVENAGSIEENVVLGPISGDTSVIEMLDPVSGLPTSSLNLVVPPDEQVVVDVRFSPQVRTTNGVVIPLTVRDGEPAGELVVRGTGVTRELLLLPGCPADFGVIDAGNSVRLPRFDTELSGAAAVGATVLGVTATSLSRDDVPLESPADLLSFDLVRTIPGEALSWGVTEITPVFSGGVGEYRGTLVIETDRETAPEIPCDFRLTVLGEAGDTGGDDAGEPDAGEDVAPIDAGADAAPDVVADADENDADDTGDAGSDAVDTVDEADEERPDAAAGGGGGGGCAAAPHAAQGFWAPLIGLAALVLRRRRNR